MESHQVSAETNTDSAHVSLELKSEVGAGVKVDAGPSSSSTPKKKFDKGKFRLSDLMSSANGGDSGNTSAGVESTSKEDKTNILKSPFISASDGVINSCLATLTTAPNGTTANGVSSLIPPYLLDRAGHLTTAEGNVVIHEQGVEFRGTGQDPAYYKLSLDQIDVLQVVGRGQYGTVHKVYHRPSARIMAMKEIRLDVSESSMKQIMMELEVLHRSSSTHIIDFYGAFFAESCVYYCMEFMDAGSIDHLYPDPNALVGEALEPILAKVAHSIVSGLVFLKENLSIIHRDVKPSNILVNTQGIVKLCDFGVSGKLIQSMAKTNIGCQSYMSPDRITSGDQRSYSVESDIWSFGLTMVEIATGKYPYPSSKRDSLFAQLAAIVQGEPPNVPVPPFSSFFHNFISQCLKKDPALRASYSDLLKHQFITRFSPLDSIDLVPWVREGMIRNAHKYDQRL